MNNILKVSKYILWEFRWSLLVFYSIILSIGLLTLIFINRITEQNGDVSFGGLSFAVIVFLVVSGLNSYRINFKFMLVNNISRKNFFYGSVITFALISGFMAVIDGFFNRIFISISSYQSLYFQLYKTNNFFDEFLWSFSIFFFAISLGWMITMIYYRSNKLMKLIVSISPGLLIILFISINNLTNIQIDKAIGENFEDFIIKMFSLNEGYNSNFAFVTFFIATFVWFIFSFLLNRRMPLKE